MDYLMYFFPYYFTPYDWLLIPAFIFMLVAQFKVSSTFKKYSRVPSRAGVTGADVARVLLQARGIDLPIERTERQLGDHYDPVKKVVRLSPGVHDSTSVAALGVAAHETGHALQHADAYGPLVARNAFFPVAGFASKAMIPLLFLSVLTGFRFPLVLYALVFCFAAYAIYAVVTLPVEFNASSRALKLLGNAGILTADETPKARAVLNAAALTYVASAAYAVINLLRILAMARDE